MKYVVVSGGVISGIGKGVLASSTGLLFKTLGLKVTSIKIDPYMNIDAGTMSPLEHGEVFVLNDGGESDLDLGNYERYLNITLTKDHNITTGKVYTQVIDSERRGEYLGKTVQVVPHLTDAIQNWIERVAQIPVDESGETPDICIVELGGTVGDIESAPFVEALRQFQFRVGKENFALIHVSLVPVIHGEQKTKPTQAAIKDLRSLGLMPDVIACRCSHKLEKPTTNKISMFCHVAPEQVLAVHDLNSTYHVPLLLLEQNLMGYFTQRLALNALPITDAQKAKGEALLQRWRSLTRDFDHSIKVVKIALVGKYINLKDSYTSVVKALEHASMRVRRRLEMIWIDSEDLETKTGIKDKAKFHAAWHALCGADGVVIPGGFGDRGTEGMMAAARWARNNKTPLLGVCLGFQIATIDFVREHLGIENSDSQEFSKDMSDDKAAVIRMWDIDQENLGGTMRLGLQTTKFTESSNSVLQKLYGGAKEVHERHRHRFEINPKFIDAINEKGLEFVGKDESGQRMEIFQLRDHPFFVGTQYHPEYLSKVLEPSKPFLGLVSAAAGVLDKVLDGKLAASAEHNDF